MRGRHPRGPELSHLAPNEAVVSNRCATLLADERAAEATISVGGTVSASSPANFADAAEVTASGPETLEVPTLPPKPMLQPDRVELASDLRLEDLQPVPRRLSIMPSAIENVVFGAGPEPVSAPHLLKVLLSTVLATDVSTPICVVLPSTEQVPETLAVLSSLECLAADLPRTREDFLQSLKPGMRVRLYPNGEVFEIAAVMPDKSLSLLMMDKATYRSRGTRHATGERVFWFEPTTRHHPLGTQFTKLDRPARNQLDLILGAQVFGNSGLVRTRILLAGDRTEFKRTLTELPVMSREAPAAVGVRDFFHYGAVDETGTPYVIERSGSAGGPMVAIGRDLLDLEQACLANGVKPGSRVVLTDRVDMVMRDLDLAGRIAERQRLVLFADARRRADVEHLAGKGWTVWEPGLHEILGLRMPAGPSGCAGLDASIRGAAAELLRSPGFISCKAQPLKCADAALASLGQYLGDEAVEHEAWVEDLLSDAKQMFFASAGWLATPSGESLDIAVATVARIRRMAERVESRLGPEAAIRVLDLADALDEFRTTSKPGSVTAKGSELLRLARTSSQTSLRQVFVTGNRQSREEADAFFESQELPIRCVAVRELGGVLDADSVVAFSVMRRDLFERLVDPWPSASTLFVGYDFENECYRRRLGRRHALRERLRLSDDERTRLTMIGGASFPEPAHPPAPDRLHEGGVTYLAAFDRVAREFSWTRRISVPTPRIGEETREARVVRFSGRSWCAMTEEHEVIVIGRDAKGAPSAWHACVGDLVPGSRIIVREGGDRDVIRLLAEEIKGAANYGRLRQKAGLWRSALRSATTDPAVVRSRLKDVGIRRNPATIRAWLTHEPLIGPRSIDDLQAIAKAFGNPATKAADWEACSNAIREIRALHQIAGARLTETLADRCGKMLLEPSDAELAVDLGVGTVWVLEVASVEKETRNCPSSYVNRLQWHDPAWRLRLLASQLRDQVA